MFAGRVAGRGVRRRSTEVVAAEQPRSNDAPAKRGWDNALETGDMANRSGDVSTANKLLPIRTSYDFIARSAVAEKIPLSF